VGGRAAGVGVGEEEGEGGGGGGGGRHGAVGGGGGLASRKMGGGERRRLGEDARDVAGGLGFFGEEAKSNRSADLVVNWRQPAS
jgi:hypothetical protein